MLSILPEINSDLQRYQPKLAILCNLILAELEAMDRRYNNPNGLSYHVQKVGVGSRNVVLRHFGYDPGEAAVQYSLGVSHDLGKCSRYLDFYLLRRYKEGERILNSRLHCMAGASRFLEDSDLVKVSGISEQMRQLHMHVVRLHHHSYEFLPKDGERGLRINDMRNAFCALVVHAVDFCVSVREQRGYLVHQRTHADSIRGWDILNGFVQPTNADLEMFPRLRFEPEMQRFDRFWPELRRRVRDAAAAELEPEFFSAGNKCIELSAVPAPAAQTPLVLQPRALALAKAAS